jgi:dTDP-4-dehydrorhamnose 3,5-epimerase
MQVEPLAVADALVITPRQHADDRGVFLEAFRADVLAEHTGRRLDLQQTNVSVSRAGVVRGVHWTDVLPGAAAGQAKYVTCPSGRALDVLVDLRVGSPTFGAVDAVELDQETRRAVWLPEGIGHAFMALEDGTTLLYLCSSTYDPEHDRTITPTDPALALPLPPGLPALLSPKDEAGPTLAQAQQLGLLPRHADCQALYRSLAA